MGFIGEGNPSPSHQGFRKKNFTIPIFIKESEKIFFTFSIGDSPITL